MFYFLSVHSISIFEKKRNFCSPHLLYATVVKKLNWSICNQWFVVYITLALTLHQHTCILFAMCTEINRWFVEFKILSNVITSKKYIYTFFLTTWKVFYGKILISTVVNFCGRTISHAHTEAVAILYAAKQPDIHKQKCSTFILYNSPDSVGLRLS